MKRKLWKRPEFIAPLTFALCILCSLNTFASPPGPLQRTKLSLENRSQQTLLVLEGPQSFRYTSFQLSNPARLVLDFKGLQAKHLRGEYAVADGPLRKVQVQYLDGVDEPMSRIVVYLRGNHEWQTQREKDRLSFVFAGSTSHKAIRSFLRPQAHKAVEAPSQPAALPAATSLRFKGAQQDALIFRTNGRVQKHKTITLRSPSRIVLDLYGVQKAPRRAKLLSCRKFPIRRIRYGRHADKLRIVLDACKKHLPPQFAIQVTEKSVEVRFGAKEQQQHARVDKIQKQLQAENNQGPRRLEDIGFGETSKFSTVMLRFRGKAPRAKLRHNGRLVVLDLAKIALPARLRKPLDTSEFRGLVQKIEVFAHKRGVRLVAQLSERAKSSLLVEQDLIQWRFPIPAASQKAQATAGNYRITYHPKQVGQAAGGGSATPAADPMSSDVLATLARQRPRKRYTGRRISMYFRKVEIHNLLRLFAEISGLNIITSDAVKGNITLKLRNVPWDQALDIVLKTLKLGKEKEGNIIRITTLNELRREAEERQRLLRARLLAQPQKIRLIPVNYAKAAAMAQQVRAVLSPRGRVSIDTRTNVLIVKDFVPFLLRAEGLVRSLDTQTPQVLIEARIVEANVNFERQFGIQWGGSLLFSPLTGNSTGLLFPNPVGIRGGVPDQGGGGAEGTFGTPNYIVNFPASTGRGRGTAVNFFFGSLTGAFDLSLRLSAAESAGDVKIISAPKIVTLHNMAANIQQGLQIPFSTASAAGTNVQFVAATLSLTVTPQVTTDGSVFLNMSVTNNAPDFSRGGSSGPAISTKTARTNMLIKDGETMVIGGVYSRRTGASENRVPFLGSIPILGALFKNYTYNDDRAELLIFVTPRIINRAKTLGGRQGS
ncbi:MAG: type IV pilus secretin PilQ [Myxococcales bacterium]|nr:type IV pilus secretin PilQ [Myxococcales bacterium]MCB9643425.1 type IV pilus secretin PilQ [Myxococcales bacterium]